MNKRCLLLISLAAFELGVSTYAHGYESEIHQQLTFIAARQFNACAQGQPDMYRLSALDTRYIVKANVGQADGNFFVRMFRWHYYNREDQTNRSIWGIVDTRFHKHFDGLVEAVEKQDSHRGQLKSLGQLISYIQKVSSPPNAVPVFSGRWWRFSMTDRFNRFPVDTARIERVVSSICPELQALDSGYQQILTNTANETIAAVQSQIFGLPAAWTSFWKLADKPNEFGEYGRAGNQFGSRTQFRCGDGERCLLLDRDPLYADFAADRHEAAVLATMRAIMRFQMRQPEQAKQ